MNSQGLKNHTSLPKAHETLKRSHRLWSRLCLALAVLAATAGSASATTIVGGSNLLSSAGADLLEGWLGEGELELTNIFTKGPGDTSEECHDAVDGMGRTFSLIEVVDDQGNLVQIIGGYNPQSWSSVQDYNYTYPDAERTAFLFNLTSSEIQRQRLSTSELGTEIGVPQTLNYPNYGPTFGGGHDLYTDALLSLGYAYSHTYGTGGNYGWGYGITGGGYFVIGQIEIFTIALEDPNAPIPEPATMTLLGLGLAGIAARARKKSSTT